jgi:hypothetical protein
MASPLHRTQILLREEQHEELSALAERRGISLSELIRKLVDGELQAQEEQRRARIDRRLRALPEVKPHTREALSNRGGRPLEVDLAALIEESREVRDVVVIGRLAAAGD